MTAVHFGFEATARTELHVRIFESKGSRAFLAVDSTSQDTPNAITRLAMEDIRLGRNLHRAESIEDLLRQLNEPEPPAK